MLTSDQKAEYANLALLKNIFPDKMSKKQVKRLETLKKLKALADNQYNFANILLFSDINPYEIIGRTNKTLKIREMNAELDPSFKPEFVPGGFCATCVNQDLQKWNCTSNENNTVYTARLHKDGYYYSKLGKHSLSTVPIKFYDYNF